MMVKCPSNRESLSSSETKSNWVKLACWSGKLHVLRRIRRLVQYVVSEAEASLSFLYH